jgi:histidinol-phosphate aminotransferase
MEDAFSVTPRPPLPRGSISALEPYVPGRPASSPDGSMASNESPFGPSPRVTEAVTLAARELNRYPDPLASRLRNELAQQLHVDADRILVGNGSDEIIYLLAMAYAANGGSVVCADPPYRIDEIVPVIMGASVTKVPLRAWRHDLDAMAAIDADIAFVCNPHNPTGTLIGKDTLRSFLRHCRARLVVVDEAYLDFADDPAGTTLVAEAAGKLVVLRTFSKIHGLAGARVGFLVGSPEIVGVLRAIRPPFSVGGMAQAAALAALSDRAHSVMVRHEVRLGRQRLSELFVAAGYKVVPSQANFVLVLAHDATELWSRLDRDGVSVRLGSSLGVPGAVRVSVPAAAGFALLERALGLG